MRTALSMLLVLCMLAVLGVLFAGVIGLGRGADPARQNRLMRWRVGLQALALLVFALLLLLLRS